MRFSRAEHAGLGLVATIFGLMAIVVALSAVAGVRWALEHSMKYLHLLAAWAHVGLEVIGLLMVICLVAAILLFVLGDWDCGVEEEP